MKNFIPFFLIFTLLGCASTGYQMARNVSNEINGLDRCVEKMREETDEATDSLSLLLQKGTGDLRSQFKKFSANFRRLEATSVKCTALSKNVRSLGRDYFITWEKRISRIENPQVYKKSYSSLIETQANQQDANEIVWEARRLYEPFVRDLGDIQQFLSLDLNAQSVDMIRPIAQATLDRKEMILQILMDVSKSLGAASEEYSTKLNK